MTNKAVTYAEETLGVHTVYDSCVEARNRLDSILTELSTARDKKRDTEFRLADREMDILSDERGKHPDMSATAMKDHHKTACWKDSEWRELREQIGKASDEITGIEYDEKIAEADLKIATARMLELAGYFQYLAAVKLVANSIKEVPVAGTVVEV